MADNIRMADVSQKISTQREAVAEAIVVLGRSVIRLIKNNKIPKGDVLAAAKIAGILAAKKTPDVIPLCHPVKVSHIDINFKVLSDRIIVESTVKAQDVTGVEMEALICSAISALTIYDMCKPLKKDIVIDNLRLIKKTGGKSGIWMAPLEIGRRRRP